MINRVVLVGRIARDPEMNTTTTGKSVCSFSLAVAKRVKPSDGSPEADFFRVSAWGKTAEFVAEYLGKGRLVALDGRLQSRKYTTTDGQSHEVVEIVAENVQSLERPRDGDPPHRDPAPDAPSVDEYDPFKDDE